MNGRNVGPDRPKNKNPRDKQEGLPDPTPVLYTGPQEEKKEIPLHLELFTKETGVREVLGPTWVPLTRKGKYSPL